MTNVKMLLNSGASFHLKDTPASQPNASQMTNAVVSGSTHAAKNDAAIRPMANRASAYLPANGASAAAASAALADDDSLRIQHSARGDDDEPRDQASSYGAGDHIDLAA